MTNQQHPITILMADDDPDDRLFAREALEANNLGGNLSFVEDGEELMEYLQHTGRYAEAGSARRPGVILLDLKMPRMDGREVLQAIKADPKLRGIPIVVLTSSAAQQDVFRSYDLGASSHITKPMNFGEMVDTMRTLKLYWHDLVSLPESR